MNEQQKKMLDKCYALLERVGEFVFVSLESNRQYELRMSAQGQVYCTCPGWKFQRLPTSQRTCKHLRRFWLGQIKKNKSILFI